jgi:hypothetical protein
MGSKLVKSRVLECGLAGGGSVSRCCIVKYGLPLLT